MTKRLISVILITIMSFTIPTSNASASIIKHKTLPNGVVTYYVSSHEENFLVMNMIKARMEQEAYIIYSGEMANRDNYYLNDMTNYDYMPQNKITGTSYNVGNFFSASLSSKTNNNGTTTAHLYMYYRADIDETKYVYDKIHDAIKENISSLQNDYQKVYWAYHWVIDTFSYDKESAFNASVYDGFTDSGAVCSGYATLYSAVMNELGIECVYVGGSVGEDGTGEHAWNIVKLNGEWYCVDATWGDSQYGDKFFLKSKETFESAEYGYHRSKLYDYYIMYGEYFASKDYDTNMKSENSPMMPSVYNIKMDVLKYNTLRVGEGYTFMINNSNNVPISFKSDNPQIAKVDKNGVITGVSEGITTVVAYNKELNIEQRCRISVDQCDEAPDLSEKNIYLKLGQNFKVKIDNLKDSSKVNFISSNPKVAKVNRDTGKVTAMKKGKCKITCTIQNGTYIYVLTTNVTVE